jgi:hypothetical protein
MIHLPWHSVVELPDLHWVIVLSFLFGPRDCVGIAFCLFSLRMSGGTIINQVLNYNQLAMISCQSPDLFEESQILPSRIFILKSLDSTREVNDEHILRLAGPQRLWHLVQDYIFRGLQHFFYWAVLREQMSLKLMRLSKIVLDSSDVNNRRCQVLLSLSTACYGDQVKVIKLFFHN